MSDLEPGAAQGQAACKEPPTLNMDRLPSEVNPAVFDNALAVQEKCQGFAIGSMLGASAEARTLTEQNRWGQVGKIMHAISDLQTAQLCLPHNGMLPGGSLRSLQQRDDNAMAYAASRPDGPSVLLTLPSD